MMSHSRSCNLISQSQISNLALKQDGMNLYINLLVNYMLSNELISVSKREDGFV